jgi:hypothetical protein
MKWCGVGFCIKVRIPIAFPHNFCSSTGHIRHTKMWVQCSHQVRQSLRDIQLEAQKDFWRSEEEYPIWDQGPLSLGSKVTWFSVIISTPDYRPTTSWKGLGAPTVDVDVIFILGHTSLIIRHLGSFTQASLDTFQCGYNWLTTVSYPSTCKSPSFYSLSSFFYLIFL